MKHTYNATKKAIKNTKIKKIVFRNDGIPLHLMDCPSVVVATLCSMAIQNSVRVIVSMKYILSEN